MARAPGTPDIPEKTRQAIVIYLAKRSINGRIKRGAASAAAKLFGCCRQQASKFSRRYSKACLLPKGGDRKLQLTRFALRGASPVSLPPRTIVVRHYEHWPTLPASLKRRCCDTSASST
ncbi:hypothetical protein PC116_g17401 [Phytophthora cactorum]|nr:hypothetical protein Pcac1_g921 [Phytophthora cactorum]KAG3031084.1 hypothetical protein PC120_g3365 [Phytophthora cactorum]KAG3036014.1 hypothetical protein PC119_g4402 [Phytophthora cactorum]KAG3184112.1 hypothetical protein C6341_g5163 [Phytophthora cactorum]KAG3206019.1 hypothetical protein PC128_g1032 [Phytophthora cactorum]